MNKTTIIFLLLIAQLSAFAQTKSEAAQDYLGARFEDIAPRGKSTWYYRDMQIQTTNAGDRSWKEELTNRLGFTERSAGPLEKIVLLSAYDGKEYTIPRSKQAAPPAKKELVTRTEAAPLFAEEKQDSASLKKTIDGVVNSSKYNSDDAKEAWGNIWDGAVDMFSHWKPLVFLLILVLWFIAAFTGGEALINQYGQGVVGRFFLNIHNFSKAALGIPVMILGAFYLISLFMYLYRAGLGIEFVFIICSFAAIPIVKLLNRYCTDVKMIYTRPGGNGLPNGNQQLGRGGQQ